MPPFSQKPTCVTELLMSCVCIYAPHLSEEDGLPSSCQRKFEPWPRRVRVIIKRQIHQVLIWFEVMGEDSLSLLYPHVRYMRLLESGAIVSLGGRVWTLWSQSATLW